MGGGGAARETSDWKRRESEEENELSDLARMEKTKREMDEQILGTSATKFSELEAEGEQLAKREQSQNASRQFSCLSLAARPAVSPTAPRLPPLLPSFLSFLSQEH